MYIVLLKFSENRSQVGTFMEGHKAWIKAGFDDGVFLLAGSLQPGLGGTVLAHNTTLAELERRVDSDPFVAENVVTSEILEVAPAKVSEQLGFLLH